MSQKVAHNISVAKLISILENIPYKYVDAFVGDDLTLMFTASSLSPEGGPADEDVNQLIS